MRLSVEVFYVLVTSESESEVGQTIAFCRLSPQPALEDHRGFAGHNRPRKAIVCPHLIAEKQCPVAPGFLQEISQRGSTRWIVEMVTRRIGGYGEPARRPFPVGFHKMPPVRRGIDDVSFSRHKR